MPLIRSILHALVMLVTVIPWGIWMVTASLWANGEQMYWKAARWLGWQIDAARILCGVEVRVSGMENLPTGKTSPAILLVKHQSTFETFLMPTLMPAPMPSGSAECSSVPTFLYGFHWVHPNATAIFVFKTAAFVRSATPPRQ